MKPTTGENPGRALRPWPALLLLASLLASCASPARLDRVHSLGDPRSPLKGASLHDLLEISLQTPNEGESAHALGHAVALWNEEFGSSDSGLVEAKTREGETAKPFRVRFRTSGSAHFRPSYFDELEPAVDYRVKRLPRITEEGIGTPMKALRENTGRLPDEVHYPPEAITREITAVIHPGPERSGYREVEIELLCSLYHDYVTVQGRREKLAADYTVALAALLARAKALKKSELGDILTPSPTREPNLYLMERYDPGKEPLIMIHGLLDSPLVWAELTNHLRGDPAVRDRYQIWHFLYNTSAPALYSGRLLRTQFREMRQEFDPGRNSRAFRDVTLLCHSMGGIVARGLITEPGNAFWEVGFTRPLSSLQLSTEDRDTLQEAFFWRGERSVGRVIFVCVPHRGSRFADNPIGKFGRAIVNPPSEFQDFYLRVSEANPGAFTEAYAELGEGKLDSVAALSPEQPTLQILSDLPVVPGLRQHSIIANRGRPGPIEKSSDGVVPYWSSHIDGVDSEKIVPSDHGALDHPDTLEEVRRLLLLR